MATATKRIRRTRLTNRQETPRDILMERLAPLKRGMIVKLTVEMTRKQGKMIKHERALLLLTPGPFYGMVPDAVVIALIGKGSRVVFPKTGKGAGELARAGMPPALAKALIENLNKLMESDNAT